MPLSREKTFHLIHVGENPLILSTDSGIIAVSEVRQQSEGSEIGQFLLQRGRYEKVSLYAVRGPSN